MKSCLAIIACAGILQGCSTGVESAKGFRLPDGDTERGMIAFEDLRCGGCHTIPGAQGPAAASGSAGMSVTLGGDVTRVKTYGELVTSIINPSHKLAPGYKKEDVSVDGESMMEAAYLNDVMTVQQLVDLVVFLQPLYEVTPPSLDPYRYMYP
jgi:hypothetical protein